MANSTPTPRGEAVEPCPFCGGVSIDPFGTAHRYMVCNTCEGEGPIADTTELAIAAWNTRAASAREGEKLTALAAENERLRTLVESAYREGWLTVFEISGTERDHIECDWKRSAAKAASEVKQ